MAGETSGGRGGWGKRERHREEGGDKMRLGGRQGKAWEGRQAEVGEAGGSGKGMEIKGEAKGGKGLQGKVRKGKVR